MDTSYHSRGINGSLDGAHATHHPPKMQRNFKLLSDPYLNKGATKLYRFDGIVESDPTYPLVVLRDPRIVPLTSRGQTNKRRTEFMELAVPRFKIDHNYVGRPPSIEITITNLNDNIDKQFLSGMLNKCGLYDEMVIYHHPTSNKHLGLAHITFQTPQIAKVCVDKFNQKSVMGKVANSFIEI